MSDTDSREKQSRKQHHNLLLITPEGGYQSFASEQHGPDGDASLEPGADGFEVLIAGLAGRVYHRSRGVPVPCHTKPDCAGTPHPSPRSETLALWLTGA